MIKRTYKNKKCKICKKIYTPEGSTQKYCYKCGKIYKKEYNKEFFEKNKDKRKEYLEKNKEKIVEQSKEYRQRPEIKEKIIKFQKEFQQRIKKRIISYYSKSTMKCKKCGFSDLRALSIDHLNGGGNNHLKEIKGGLYSWIIKNNFPKKMFQVLCMNCQWIKRVENDEHRKRTI